MALHNGLTQTIDTGDEYRVTEAGFGIQREHHTTGPEIRADHFHHPHGERDFEVIEPIIDAIDDGAVSEE